MSFAALDHIGFAVSDIERSTAWYTELLEQPAMMRREWRQAYVAALLGYDEVVLDCAFWRLPGGAVLELIQYVVPAAARVDMETYNVGNAHLCLVTEAIERDCARLRDVAAFRAPQPIRIPWGPYEGGRACYLRDPDGISVELLELPPGGPRFDGVGA
jgi:catechol 2,3-dioxygenase-like lactoylglutathione lyase family enzyme